MADEKISEMTPATTLGDSDVLPIVQSSTNKKSSVLLIQEYLFGSHARFVAITGPPAGVKLQVKNGSGTWEDVFEYVAST